MNWCTAHLTSPVRPRTDVEMFCKGEETSMDKMYMYMYVYIYIYMWIWKIMWYIGILYGYIYIYVCIYSIYMDIWYRLKIDQRKIQTGSPAKIVAKCGKWLRFPWREIYTVTYRNDGPLVVFGTKEVECNLWGGTPKMKCQTYVIYDGRSCDTEAISLNR